MRIAVIADIHSNDLALAAVLEDIASAGVDRIVHLGDAFNGPINPQGVVRLLKTIEAVHVRGNGERMVLGIGPEKATKSALYARTKLTAEDLAFAASWPAVAREEWLVACHGSPRSDTEYLLEKVTPTVVELRSPQEVAEILKDDGAALVLCGHTHVAATLSLPDGSLVVNAGSVGLPAYADALPFLHKMEAGSPHARYALVERTGESWQAALRAVAYDWEKAAALAIANGFPEWARALRTGRV
ncbi:MAG: metallophosphoesterase family protein [Nibricoccus sp.]